MPVRPSLGSDSWTIPPLSAEKANWRTGRQSGYAQRVWLRRDWWFNGGYWNRARSNAFRFILRRSTQQGHPSQKASNSSFRAGDVPWIINFVTPSVPDIRFKPSSKTFLASSGHNILAGMLPGCIKELKIDISWLRQIFMWTPPWRHCWLGQEALLWSQRNTWFTGKAASIPQLPLRLRSCALRCLNIRGVSNLVLISFPWTSLLSRPSSLKMARFPRR